MCIKTITHNIYADGQHEVTERVEPCSPGYLCANPNVREVTHHFPKLGRLDSRRPTESGPPSPILVDDSRAGKAGEDTGKDIDDASAAPGPTPLLSSHLPRPSDIYADGVVADGRRVNNRRRLGETTGYEGDDEERRERRRRRREARAAAAAVDQTPIPTLVNPVKKELRWVDDMSRVQNNRTSSRPKLPRSVPNKDGDLDPVKAIMPERSASFLEAINDGLRDLSSDIEKMELARTSNSQRDAMPSDRLQSHRRIETPSGRGRRPIIVEDRQERHSRKADCKSIDDETFADRLAEERDSAAYMDRLRARFRTPPPRSSVNPNRGRRSEVRYLDGARLMGHPDMYTRSTTSRDQPALDGANESETKSKPPQDLPTMVQAGPRPEPEESQQVEGVNIVSDDSTTRSNGDKKAKEAAIDPLISTSGSSDAFLGHEKPASGLSTETVHMEPQLENGQYSPSETQNATAESVMAEITPEMFHAPMDSGPSLGPSAATWTEPQANLGANHPEVDEELSEVLPTKKPTQDFEDTSDHVSNMSATTNTERSIKGGGGSDVSNTLYYIWICHMCKSEMSWDIEPPCSNVSCEHHYCKEECKIVARPVFLGRDRTPEGWPRMIDPYLEAVGVSQHVEALSVVSADEPLSTRPSATSDSATTANTKATSITTLGPLIDPLESERAKLEPEPREASQPTGSNGVKEEGEEDVDEYSDAGSLAGMEDEATTSFAEWLQAMVRHQLGDVSSTDMHAVLPEDILQEFAIRLAHEGKTKDHRRLMYVAHKPASYKTVAMLLGMQCAPTDSNPMRDESELSDDVSVSSVPDDERRGEPGMDWRERISELLGRSAPLQDSHPAEASGAPKQADPYDAYRQILLEAGASRWLMAALRQTLALRGVAPSSMHAIRHKILSALRHRHRREWMGGRAGHPTWRISRRRNPHMHVAHFELQWNPVTFIQEEFSGIQGTRQEFLSQVMTVTGKGNVLQALPCRDYMVQTWPLSGLDFLSLIQGLLADPGKPSELRLKNGSSLVARIQDGQLHLVAKGTDFEISEAAEQLAWLGSALQPAGQHKYAVCEARLSESHGTSDNPPEESSFLIDFVQSPFDGDETHACWKPLFENMPVAWGFPISSRPEGMAGLDIDIGVASNIIGAEKVVPFKGRMLIKGFSAMLYPTKVDFEDGTIVWHLLGNTDGSRISFADPRVGHHDESDSDGVHGLRYEHLESARNIIGWCPSVKNVTGTAEANFSIGASNLGPLSPGWVLETVQIAGGQYMTLGFTFGRGKRLRALKVGRNKDDLIGRLEWLTEKHVILYDTLDRRAWLVDGPSALLHLARASLVVDGRRFPKQKYLSALESLPSVGGEQLAAIDVLTDDQNLALELRSKGSAAGQNGGDDMYRFRDRVNDILGILEQLIDHMADMKPDKGVGFQVARSDWNRLEGFDFLDVARRSDPFDPKGVVLGEDGKGWVKFTLAIHAVTLFGHGFGDLLKPVAVTTEGPGSGSCHRCYWNDPAPAHRDILAVSMADLQNLHGHVPQWACRDPGSRLVVQRFIWDRPGSCFGPCACVPGKPCAARVQTFRERPAMAWARRKAEPDTGEVSLAGAVLLGIHRHMRHTPAPAPPLRASDSRLGVTGADGAGAGVASETASELLTAASATSSSQGSTSGTGTPSVGSTASASIHQDEGS